MNLIETRVHLFLMAQLKVLAQKVRFILFYSKYKIDHYLVSLEG